MLPGPIKTTVTPNASNMSWQHRKYIKIYVNQGINGIHKVGKLSEVPNTKIFTGAATTSNLIMEASNETTSK